MSRIGNQPIELPKDVDIQIEGSGVTVKGPRGQLSNSFNSVIAIEESDGVIKVSRPSDESEHKAFHGLTRSLIANMVTGVSEGFEKDLELVGVGYRVQQTGKGVTLSVMLSHLVAIEPPEGVTLEVEDNDNPDLEEDAAWDAFNNLVDGWYEHPTRVDAEGGCNVDIQMYGPIKETEDD